MSIIDDVRIRQTFDPTGENGGYKCETVLEDKVQHKHFMDFNVALSDEDMAALTSLSNFYEGLPFKEVDGEALTYTRSELISIGGYTDRDQAEEAQTNYVKLGFAGEDIIGAGGIIWKCGIEDE